LNLPEETTLSTVDRKFRLQVIVAFALVYVLWGSTYLGIAIAVRNIPPLMMGATRFIIAGLLMLAFRKLRGHSISLPSRDMFRLTVIGFLLLVSGNVVLGLAETIIPTGLSALLIAITPLWFLILERFFFARGDRIAPRGLAGIGLGIAGIVVLLWPDLTGTVRLGHRELLGAGLVLFSSISWATGSVLSKRWHVEADPYTASGWEMLNAGLINLALAVMMGDHHRTVWERHSVFAIIYLVFAGSLIGFTAYVWLLRNVPTPKVATYAYVNPLVAMLLGWLVMGERFTPYIFGGAAVVLASVVLVTGAKSHQAADSPSNVPDELPAIEGTGD
jgi:drug/metabolite transporter (DMT)-like permease